MLRTLRRCFRLLPSHKRWPWASLVPISVVAAAAETAGAGGVFLLISVLSDPSRAGQLPVVGTVQSLLPAAAEGTALVVWLTALLALFYVFKNGFLALVAFYQNRLFYRTIAELAQELIEGYLAVPYHVHLTRRSPELIHRITEGCNRVVNLVMASAVAGASEILVILGILTVLITVSPLAVLLTVGALGGFVAGLVWLLQRQFFRFGQREIALRKEVLQTVQQTLAGLKEIRVFGREPYYLRRFVEQQDTLAQLVTRLRFMEGTPRLLIETLFVIATLLVVLLVAGRGQRALDAIPILGLYAYAGFRVIPSFNRLLLAVNNIWYGTPSVTDLLEDLDGSGTRVDLEPAVLPSDLPFEHRIVLDQVTYAYDQQPVLSSVCLEIPRGGSVGIVGATGAGKSTLIDLVLGLLTPSEGRVTVDGVDIHAHSAAWRRKIGYVPQAIFLTDGTLRGNIAFGLEASEINDRQVAAAIRLAHLEDLLASLPEGLATDLGEGGIRLSGGQRQRVAIARALYHDPELLIFDEATSALDGHAERELSAALQALRGRKTLLVVAHRLSTIQSCEHLVFLRDGKIEAEGSYDELLQSSPAFRATLGISDG